MLVSPPSGVLEKATFYGTKRDKDTPLPMIKRETEKETAIHSWTRRKAKDCSNNERFPHKVISI